MRKFLKRFPFNKLFVSLFVTLYTFLPVLNATEVLAATPSYNGNVTGFVGADGIGVVSGYTTGDYNTNITGWLTGGIPDQWANFTGTISGDINGTINGGVNWNGYDTLSAEISGTGAVGHVYLIGGFEGGPGEFEAEFITQTEPIDFITSIDITGGDTVSLGSTLQMIATTHPSQVDVAWGVWTKPGDPNYGDASIDKFSGLLTPTKTGKIIIIASALDGSLITQNHTVTVLDTTGPSVPELLFPFDDQIINAKDLYINWAESVDDSTEALNIQYEYRLYSKNPNLFPNSSYYTKTYTGVTRHPETGYASGTAEHEYWYTVQATDEAGNKSGFAPYKRFVVDNTAPEKIQGIKIYKGHNSEDENLLGCGTYTNDTKIRISWEPSTHLNIDYYWLGTKSNPRHKKVYSPKTYYDGNMTPGNNPYYYTVIAVDKAGNESSISDPCGLILDLEPPFPPQLIYPEDPFYTQGVYFEQKWLSVDDAISYEYNSCYNDPDEHPEGYCQLKYKQKFTGEYNTTKKVGAGQPDSQFWWRVRSEDIAGNWSEWSEAREVIIDNTAPTKPIITNTPHNSLTNTNWITIKWEEGDDQGLYPSGIKGYVLRYVFTPANGGSTIVWNTGLRAVGNPQEHSGSYGHGEGTYEIFVKTVDNAGNESPESDSFTITYDNTSPTIDFELPEDGEVYSGEIDLKAVCNEKCDYINFWWRREGESYSNVSPDRRYHYVNENGTTFEWTLDTLNAERWAGDPSYIMEDGVYYLYAAGKDIVGNWAKTNEITIVVDNTAPETIFTNEISGIFTNDPIQIEGESTDLHGVTQVKLQYKETTDTTWTDLVILPNPIEDSPFIWSHTWTPDAEGTYDIKASATDTLGNEEQSPVLYAVTYDTTPPQITLLDLVLGVLKDVDANDPLSGIDKIEVSTDNLTWQDYTSGLDLNDLVGNQPGTYTIYIRVTDKAGNITTETVTFTIPSPTPTTTQTAGDILGVTSPLNPTPVQAFGTGGPVIAQTGEQDTEEEETTEETDTVDDPEVKGDEDNEEQNGEEETTEVEQTKWWIYPLVILPILAIFLILWKRRKEDNEPQF